MKRFSLLATLTFSTMVLSAQASFIASQAHNSSVVGIASGQTARLNILYPSVPAPLLQIQCQITASIGDDQGGILKSQDFLLAGGKSVSISLNADTELTGSHNAQIHAVTLTPGGPADGFCFVIPSLDIVDNATGKTVAHLETVVTYPRAFAALSGLRQR